MLRNDLEAELRRLDDGASDEPIYQPALAPPATAWWEWWAIYVVAVLAVLFGVELVRGASVMIGLGFGLAITGVAICSLEVVLKVHVGHDTRVAGIAARWVGGLVAMPGLVAIGWLYLDVLAWLAPILAVVVMAVGYVLWAQRGNAISRDAGSTSTTP